MVLGLRTLDESKDPTTRIPAFAGVVLIAASAALASLAVVQSDDWGWTDARTVTAFVTSALLFVAFVAHQRRTVAPALDLELFRIRNFAWADAASFVFGAGFTAMFFGSFLFMHQVWGYSVIRTGLGVTPGPILVALLAPRFGRLAGRVGQRPLLLLGGLVFASGGVWRLLVVDATPRYVVGFLPSMLLTGLGVALCIPQLSSVVAQALPPNRAGVGGAANQALRQFGGTLGVALTIAFVAEPTSVTAALANFDRVWVLLVVAGVLTSLCAVPLRTSQRPPAAACSAGRDGPGARGPGAGRGRAGLSASVRLGGRGRPGSRRGCARARARSGCRRAGATRAASTTPRGRGRRPAR